MLNTQHKESGVLFVKVQPGLNPTPIQQDYVRSSLAQAPSYTACALFSDTSESSASSPSTSTTQSLAELYTQLRHLEEPVHLWVEQACIDHSSEEDVSRHVGLLKDIYTAAKQVIVWAGNDNETSDECFDLYLGAGNEETTKHAFDFAHRLATADISELPELFKTCFAQGNTPSWAYLFRILCRPFFRGLPLLRTNYAAGLPNIVVRCSSSEVALSSLLKAAYRIWVRSPIPHFMRNMGVEEAEEDSTQFMRADRQYLLACIRFGFNSLELVVRILRVFRNPPGSQESTSKRLLVHLGYCDDLYEMEGRMDSVRREEHKLDAMETDPASYLRVALDPKTMKKWPSLRFEGRLSPAPRAVDQAPFIHFELNRQHKIALVELLPATSVLDPIQCGLVEFPINNLPAFHIVTNSTFLRKVLPHEDYCGANFSVTTRHTVPILVNGQAFIIPRLQEIFLRLFRNSSDSFYISLWNVCVYPHETIHTIRDLQGYLNMKREYEVAYKGTDLDMYSVLDDPPKAMTVDEMAQLGLPDGMSWDDWILDMND
ncbi:hypothetical protein BX600DRAFT_250886 [Xylariales sp. PMI_506]|nr:hypothetical protein BX600DRAFT_250886 [Xylariales sp. PMI_506]